jgi:hypothetical protein
MSLPELTLAALRELGVDRLDTRIKILHDVILLKDQQLSESLEGSITNSDIVSTPEIPAQVMETMQEQTKFVKRNRKGSLNSTDSNPFIPTSDYYDSRPVSPENAELDRPNPLLKAAIPREESVLTAKHVKKEVFESSDSEDEVPLAIKYERMSVFTVSDYMDRQEDPSEHADSMDLERLEMLRRQGAGQETVQQKTLERSSSGTSTAKEEASVDPDRSFESDTSLIVAKPDVDRELPTIPDEYAHIDRIPEPPLKDLQLVITTPVEQQPPALVSPVSIATSPVETTSFMHRKLAEFEPAPPPPPTRRASVAQKLVSTLQRKFSKRESLIEMPSMEDCTMTGFLVCKEGLGWSKRYCALIERTLYIMKSNSVLLSDVGTRLAIDRNRERKSSFAC